VVASDLAQYVATGLLVGGVYALMSIGLALIFGVMRVVNFAQGDFMMLGMYLTYYYAVAGHVDPLLGALLTIPPFFVLGLRSTASSSRGLPAAAIPIGRWTPSSS
jgi:branched-chain amino acid transport system permease protein